VRGRVRAEEESRTLPQPRVGRWRRGRCDCEGDVCLESPLSARVAPRI